MYKMMGYSMFADGPGLRRVPIAEIDPTEYESSPYAYLPVGLSRNDVIEKVHKRIWDERGYDWELAPLPSDVDWSWDIAPLPTNNPLPRKRKGSVQSSESTPKSRGGRPEQRIYNELVAAKRSFDRLNRSGTANPQHIEKVRQEIELRAKANDEFREICNNIRKVVKDQMGIKFRTEMCHDAFRDAAHSIHLKYGLNSLPKVRA